jgi:hypothetical protein
VVKRRETLFVFDLDKNAMADLADDFTAHADFLPVAPSPPHAMSHVRGRWVTRIVAAGHTILASGRSWVC